MMTDPVTQSGDAHTLRRSPPPAGRCSWHNHNRRPQHGAASGHTSTKAKDNKMNVISRIATRKIVVAAVVLALAGVAAVITRKRAVR
jgi:hypothetical protein